MSQPLQGALVGLAVDVVAFSLQAGALQVLLVERAQGPHAQAWALPGSMVNVGEELSAAALRTLREAAALPLATGPLEQLYTFGAPGRDPRGRVISVAHMVIVEGASGVPNAATRAAGLPAEAHQTARANWHSAHRPPPLAFDHTEILALALERLRLRLLHGALAFELLPEAFTLPELQSLHEAVLNMPLDKRNFRKRMLTQGHLLPAGERRSGVGRPAQLYRRKRGSV